MPPGELMAADVPEGSAYRVLTALALLAAPALLAGGAEGALLYMAGASDMIPWSLPGAGLFLAAAFLRDRLRIGRLLPVIILVLLLAAGLIFHAQLLNGAGTLMNKLYGIAEQAQAYVYDRFDVAEETPDVMRMNQRYAVLWTALVIGAALAVPAQTARKWICIALAGAVMVVFAWFGLLPAAAGMAVVLAAVLLLAGEGKVLDLLPLLAVLVLVFSVVLVIDPGESEKVSQLDEQWRDQLAFHTAMLQGEPQNSPEEPEESEDENGGGGVNLNGINELIHNVRLWNAILVALVSLLILFIPSIIHDRLEKRRRKNREGIDSEDPRTAIRAMFLYAVRWLQVWGIEAGNRPYSTLQRSVRQVSGPYAAQFADMLDLWKEAVYSDHPMTSEEALQMKTFMEETIAETKDFANWKQKLLIRFKYAL